MVDTPFCAATTNRCLMSVKRFLCCGWHKPFDANYAKDLAAKLKTMGAKNIPEFEKDIKDGFGLGCGNTTRPKLKNCSNRLASRGLFR